MSLQEWSQFCTMKFVDNMTKCRNLYTENQNPQHKDWRGWVAGGGGREGIFNFTFELDPRGLTLTWYTICSFFWGAFSQNLV